MRINDPLLAPLFLNGNQRDPPVTTHRIEQLRERWAAPAATLRTRVCCCLAPKPAPHPTAAVIGHIAVTCLPQSHWLWTRLNLEAELTGHAACCFSKQSPRVSVYSLSSRRTWVAANDRRFGLQIHRHGRIMRATVSPGQARDPLESNAPNYAALCVARILRVDQWLRWAFNAWMPCSCNLWSTAGANVSQVAHGLMCKRLSHWITRTLLLDLRTTIALIARLPTCLRCSS